VLYELRSYDIRPERWDDYLNWAYTTAWPILFEAHGFPLVGWWQVVPNADEPPSSTNLQWILAWESEEQRNERWAALLDDDAWKAAVAATRDPASGDSLYHLRTRYRFLRPLPRSPLQ